MYRIAALVAVLLIFIGYQVVFFANFSIDNMKCEHNSTWNETKPGPECPPSSEEISKLVTILIDGFGYKQFVELESRFGFITRSSDNKNFKIFK